MLLTSDGSCSSSSRGRSNASSGSPSTAKGLLDTSAVSSCMCALQDLPNHCWQVDGGNLESKAGWPAFVRLSPSCICCTAWRRSIAPAFSQAASDMKHRLGHSAHLLQYLLNLGCPLVQYLLVPGRWSSGRGRGAAAQGAPNLGLPSPALPFSARASTAFVRTSTHCEKRGVRRLFIRLTVVWQRRAATLQWHQGAVLGQRQP